MGRKAQGVAEVMKLLGQSPEGLQVAEVVQSLGLPREQRASIRRLLKEMVRLGRVEQRGRRFALSACPDPAGDDALVGQLRVSPHGWGTVVLDDDAAEPLHVDAEELGAALDGDRVEVDPLGCRSRGRSCATVTRVAERGRRRVAGKLDVAQGRLLPEDARLAVRQCVLDSDQRSRLEPEALAGKIVLAEVTAYPSDVEGPLLVKVTRVLGEGGLPTTEVGRVLWEQHIDEAFPEQVEAEAQAVADHLRAADHVDRVDLRDRPFVTIDPETARDFDDAVAIEDGPEGTTRVWVAVADVSHYVQPDSAMDTEAAARGCSVYLPDRAIPMLPHRLSSGICSLVPKRDRLAMVVRLDIDHRGRIADSDCMAAVIHSRGQLDYEGVAAAFRGEIRGRRKGYGGHIEQLQRLRDVTRLLRARRLRRGSLDLELPESKVLVDEDDPDRVRDIVPSRQDETVREAYGLIEDLMLAANEAVAQVFERREEPTIWRVHDRPDTHALYRLAGWLAAYGIEVDAEQLAQPKAMSKLMRNLRDNPAGRPLTYLALRSLKQAAYRVTNSGHFGLASSAYLHFTSPIRRYPDLMVHRLLKARLHADGKPSGGQRRAAPVPNPRRLGEIAAHASKRERAAIEVTRRVDDIYAASLMRDRIGDEFGGQITGLTGFGVFVGLDAPQVDGMVRVEDLPEPVRLDARAQRITSRSGRCVSLGDRVQVEVLATSVTMGRIDLGLIDHHPRFVETQPQGRRRSPRPGARGPQRPAKSGQRGRRRRTS